MEQTLRKNLTLAMAAGQVPYRQIRASYDDKTITVYQAYKASIADAAIAKQKLDASPDLKFQRMTWIKPSWSWMLYRAGYSYKDPGQERILALKMKHEDFIGLLKNADVNLVHSAVATGDRARVQTKERRTEDEPAKVKVQWDPERTVRLDKLPYRSIQIGIPGALSQKWVEDWIVSIEDVTVKARELKKLLDEQPDIADEKLVELGLVPQEREYVVPEEVLKILGMVQD